MAIQWFPGHMTKAVRAMEEDIKLVDLLIELADARIPISSRNPEFDRIAGSKLRMVIMNKSDLADEQANKAWLSYYEENNISAVLMDARSSKGTSELKKKIADLCAAKKARDLKRGIKNRPVRAMVVGIPNVGKSTFINTYAGKAVAKTGNKPGVTRGKQWIKLAKDLELLDTPGVLWPKFDDEATGMHLAMIGSISDDILDKQEIACGIIQFMEERYAGRLRERYEEDFTGAAYETLEKIAIKKGCLKKGGEADIDKCAGMITDDLRSMKLGRITIETPEDIRQK